MNISFDGLDDDTKKKKKLSLPSLIGFSWLVMEKIQLFIL